MFTVLAENRQDGAFRAIVDLPATEGQLSDLRRALGTETDDNIKIRYAGTNEYWGMDSAFLENCFDDQADIHELNLLAYLTERMPHEDLSEFDVKICDLKGDFCKESMKDALNMAYDFLAKAAGVDEPPLLFNGDNIVECTEAERILIADNSEQDEDDLSL